MAEQLLALSALLVCSVLGGLFIARLGLPPLVGMLLAGLGLRNLVPDLIERIPEDWSVALRLLALTVILIRAGLGLDLVALRRLRGPFLRLSFLPNLAEAAAVAFASAALFDLPATWAILLGFVIAAVSPAVVVPGLLELQSRGFGVAKGIPTMILAAASFDDVLAITGFGLSVSLLFTGADELSFAAVLLRAPLELAFGLGLGLAAGLFCGLAGRAAVGVRFLMLSVSGLAAVFGGWLIGFTGGGSLAAITVAAVAANRWAGDTAPVARQFGRVWLVAQPLLFGFIGAAVVLSVIETSYITTGLAVLAIGLVVRVLVSFGSVANADFLVRERLFVAVAWIPKATVQAAIGGLALDLAREQGLGPQAEIYGTQVLTVAVLAILATAPVGAVAIATAGPRWLQRQSDANF